MSKKDVSFNKANGSKKTKEDVNAETLSALSVLSSKGSKKNEKANNKSNFVSDYKITKVSLDELVSNKDNSFYSLDGIRELANAIYKTRLNTPLVVSAMEEGGYEIIGGHRRYHSLSLLSKEEKLDSSEEIIPVYVIDVDDPNDKKYELLMDNILHRNKNDWETICETAQLKSVFEEYKKSDGVKGKVVDLIAESTGYSPATVSRHITIHDNITNFFQDLLADKKLGITLAYEISMIPTEHQNLLETLNIIDYIDGLSTKNLRDLRNSLESATDKESVIKDFISMLSGDCSMKDTKELKDNSNSTKEANREVVWRSSIQKDYNSISKKVAKITKYVTKKDKEGVILSNDELNDLQLTLSSLTTYISTVQDIIEKQELKKEKIANI